MYTLVISDKFLCPIWTILTEQNVTNFISFWSNEWLRIGGSVPNELCCDMSLALLNAGVCTFTSYSNLNEYINTLFGLNFENEPCFEATAARMQCFIRIDIAHLIKNVASSESFSIKKPKVRETYIRCVALLIKATHFHEVTLLIKYILIMAYAQSEGTLILLLLLILLKINEMFGFLQNIGVSKTTAIPVACERVKYKINPRIEGKDIEAIGSFEEWSDLSDEHYLCTNDEEISDASIPKLSEWLENIDNEAHRIVASTSHLRNIFFGCANYYHFGVVFRANSSAHRILLVPHGSPKHGTRI